jgi:uncharacterized protein (TIGR02145 family)
MKRIFLIGFFLVLLIIPSTSQDSVFIYQKGKIMTAIAIEEIDSIIFYPAPEEDTITDIEGNVYNTVTIGNQIWMKENLRTTKYNDGSDIPLVTDRTDWGNLTTPGTCWYENSESIGTTYGALYNWYAVNTGKLCPTGWHAPIDEEWTILISCLGGEDIAGGKLKESGINHWESPNTGATNESGFTGLPGGYRNYNGNFDNIVLFGYWWSAKGNETAYAWNRYMNYNYAIVYRYSRRKEIGYSVRCLKDSHYPIN